MSPQDLVCARCWRDFFNTESFERCCTFNHFQGGQICKSTKIVATVSEINGTSCTWCAYITTFIPDSWMPEHVVTTALTPSFMKSCTPAGGNIFHLDIDCSSQTGEWIGGFSLFIHAWTTANDDASEYVTARPVRTDVDSEAARMQVAAWLEECKAHDCCSTSHLDSDLPTRVIEVNPPGRQYPRLLESANLRGSYATLSYCWGSTPFTTLTKSNYDQFIESLDPANLPATICHAISIARDLSISYLWIDALCIIQDSEEDKIKEIANMKHVYGSSTLTIVAASSKGVHEGLLHPRIHTESSHTVPVRIRPRFFGTMSINELDAACYDERFEPIAKRAWTMQEQLLAQRTLTFTSRTMMWRCHAGTRNFGDSLYVPFNLDAGYNDNDDKYSLNLESLLPNVDEANTHKDKALSCWLRVVTAYSLRCASDERDKLQALAGIASHPSFSRALGPGYFAGLWQYNLVRQLTWCTSKRHRTLSDDDTFFFFRPARYRAPSWSWASLEGGIIHFDFSFDDEDEEIPEVICEIVDCSTAPMSPDINPYGEVMSAQLKLRAPARWVWFYPLTSNVFPLPTSNTAESRLSLPTNEHSITISDARANHIDAFRAQHPDEDLDEDPEAVYGTDYRNMCGTHDETGAKDPLIVLCTAITVNKEGSDGVKGIMLIPSKVQNEDGMFRRIGFFERGQPEDFREDTKMEIAIV